MVVNNWYAVMVSCYVHVHSILNTFIHPRLFSQEGFASQVEADWLVRIYFMSFIIITLVVLQVVISFIVEAFVFKISAREKSRECQKHHKLFSLCGCKEGITFHHNRCVVLITM